MTDDWKRRQPAERENVSVHSYGQPAKYGISPSTAARSLAVTLESVRSRAREMTGDFDGLFRELIEEATDRLEQETSRRFINQTVTVKFDRFPYDDSPIRLPVAPVQSVTSVSYINSSGTSVTWSTSLYDVDTDQEPARIRPAYNQSYPDIRDETEVNSVTVTLVAGYGTGPDDVPPMARSAIVNRVVADFTGCGEDNKLIGRGPDEAWRSAASLLKWRR